MYYQTKTVAIPETSHTYLQHTKVIIAIKHNFMLNHSNNSDTLYETTV